MSVSSQTPVPAHALGIVSDIDERYFRHGMEQEVNANDEEIPLHGRADVPHLQGAQPPRPCNVPGNDSRRTHDLARKPITIATAEMLLDEITTLELEGRTDYEVMVGEVLDGAPVRRRSLPRLALVSGGVR